MSKARQLNYLSLRAILIASILTFTTVSQLFAQGDPLKGQELFKTNCARCHAITDQKNIGPGLQGVEGRWASRDNLKAWIKNSADFLKTGDQYANSLFEQFNGSVMPAFGGLQDQDLEDILAYVKTPPAPPAGETPTGGPGGTTATTDGSGGSDNTLIFILIGVAIVLLVLARSLNNVTRAINNVNRERSGEVVKAEEKTFDGARGLRNWIVGHKKITAVILFVLFCWAFNEGFMALNRIGVYQHYEPEQPIAFSHKLHVSQNGIECKYCHSTAEKSRHAGIPSSNVCMNCHKAVNEGPQHGRKEISKIYAAIGWNPIDKAYFQDYQGMDNGKVKEVFKEWLKETPGGFEAVQNQIQKPVEWVQVHNLPDHAFFSHQQHVTVGKVECVECHGKVEEMEKVEQFSPLTMGWCINCHRKTEVQYADNGYYTRLHEYYKKHYGEYEMGKGEPFTVEKIGGLECSKCHY